MQKTFLLLLLTLGAFACQNEPEIEDVRGEADNFEYFLEEKLLHVWYPRLIDTVNGGYWTNFEYDWTRSEEQTKFIVTQTRDLWTAAKALEFYPENDTFQQAVKHGMDYLPEMWDEEYSGFYSYAPEFAAEGANTEKMAYGNAFAIYAFAQYAKVSNLVEARDWAMKTFDWLEKTAHDPKQGGYFNRITRKGESFANVSTGNPFGESQTWGSAAWKDQNSSIHILEALTTLYEINPDSLVRERLEEMLILVRDTFVSDKGYLHLYTEADFTPVVHRDSSREYILDNLRYDHVSFGHDIETAFLLLEASHALGLGEDKKTLAVAKKLVDHTLDTGFDENYYGLFEGGYYFDENQPIEIVNNHKTWWAQIEALNSLLIFSKLYPTEGRYKEAFWQMWKYCRENMIDMEHGGWYAQGLDMQPDYRTARKAHQWKSPYHTGRGLMNIVKMGTLE